MKVNMRLLTTTAVALGLLLPAAAGAQQASGDSAAGKPSQQDLQNQDTRQTGTSGMQGGSASAGSSAKGDGGLDPATEADRRTWSRDKLVDKPLYGADGNEVGTIQDVVAGPAGEIEAVLVDVGSFLGIGSKRIAVPIEEVSLYEDRAVAAGLTKAEAENMDEYEAKRTQ